MIEISSDSILSFSFFSPNPNHELGVFIPISFDLKLPTSLLMQLTPESFSALARLVVEILPRSLFESIFMLLVSGCYVEKTNKSFEFTSPIVRSESMERDEHYKANRKREIKEERKKTGAREIRREAKQNNHHTPSAYKISSPRAHF